MLGTTLTGRLSQQMALEDLGGLIVLKILRVLADDLSCSKNSGVK